MPTVLDRSRSPVRAINTSAYQTWAGPAPRPRTWSEPDLRELGAIAASPTPEQPELACPDCGSMLRLGLVRTSTEGPWARPSRGARPALRAAPDVEPVLDFEVSIQEYKRELITRALDDNKGVMTRAAKALGLKYTTFVAMVHRLGILEDEETEARQGG